MKRKCEIIRILERFWIFKRCARTWKFYFGSNLTKVCVVSFSLLVVLVSQLSNCSWKLAKIQPNKYFIALNFTYDIILVRGFITFAKRSLVIVYYKRIHDCIPMRWHHYFNFQVYHNIFQIKTLPSYPYLLNKVC